MNRRHFLYGAFGAAFLGSSAVARASGGLDVPGADFAAAAPDVRVLLETATARRYRGRLSAIALPDGRAGTLNTVSLEEYLYGVVPMEMPCSWPAAALEAQAILARTFAIDRCTAARPYDLRAGTADQMYGGIEAEAPPATAAILASSGRIVTYLERPASIAYMSACGGHTDDAASVWGGVVPYMSGVPCPYCADAPSARWTAALPWRAIASAAGLDPGDAPTQARLVELRAGGRPGAVVFATARGEGRIALPRLRELSGYRLPSAFVHAIEIARSADAPGPAADDGLVDERAGGGGEASIVCTGSGSGHGVGVCQWGARGLAAAGYSAAAILAYYLPNTGLGRAQGPQGGDVAPRPETPQTVAPREERSVRRTRDPFDDI